MADVRYKGIKVPFNFGPTGYPEPAVNEELIASSLRSILLTTPGERVFRPTFGSWLSLLTFENLNTITAIRAREEVRRAIAEWEPRVTLKGVGFELDKTKARISVVISWEVNGKDGKSIIGLPSN